MDSLGWSPWRPTLKWRGSGAGQGRSSRGTVLANGACFIRPFGLGFIKTAGEDIPGDSINQAVLWHAVRPTDFKHLVLNRHAPHRCLPPPTPSPQTQRRKCTHTHTTHACTHTKTSVAFTNTWTLSRLPTSCGAAATLYPSPCLHNSLHLLARSTFPGGPLGVVSLQVEDITVTPRLLLWHLQINIDTQKEGRRWSAIRGVNFKGGTFYAGWSNTNVRVDEVRMIRAKVTEWEEVEDGTRGE